MVRHSLWSLLFLGACALLPSTAERVDRLLQRQNITPSRPTSRSNPPSSAAALVAFPFDPQPPAQPNNPALKRDVSAYRTGRPEPVVSSIIVQHPPHQVTSEASLRNLVQALMAGEADPFRQVKRLHDYAALTIRYDAASFLSGRLPDQSWPAVMRSRMGVCEGYANVMDVLLRRAGFDTIKIHGFARGVGTSPLNPGNPEESNHAWNAVRIEGYWYLLDATWNAGQLKGRSFVAEYSTSYFLIPAEWMIYTHYPSRPEWQYLERPYSAQEFQKLPFLPGNFFEVVEGGYQGLEIPLIVTEPTRVRLQVNPDLFYTAELVNDRGQAQPHVFSEVIGKDWDLHLAPPEGRWTLRLYAGTTEREGRGLAEFTVTSTNTERVSIPTLTSDFAALRARLLSPRLKALRPGARERLRLLVPNVAGVFVRQQNQMLPLDSEGDGIYSRDIVIPSSGTIDVFAQPRPNSRQYRGLLSLPVVR